MGSSGLIHPVNQLAADDLAPGEATIPRLMASNTPNPLQSGTMRLTYMTAVRSEQITQVRTDTGSAGAAAAPTLCRVGIYQIAADGSAVLAAATANDPTLWAAANTEYLTPLAAPLAKAAGQRYAVGLLIVTAFATPTFVGDQIAGATTQTGGQMAARPPRLLGALPALADLPANFADNALGALAQYYYVELVP